MSAGLLSRALDDWYRRSAPLDPRRRCTEVAERWGVSETLLWRYCQLDFSRRVDGY